MSINILPDEIINQIAAGEVIENPSAVVKELIENSIDSGASQIDIDIENFGFDRICVSDNGCGISKEDLLKAPLRHATSKIKSFNDLYSITSMGFRGEALASIFSIAKTKIVSKHESSNEAFEIESSNIEEVKQSGSSQGTTVIVEDLFYNTPARKKYLKSEKLELKSILDIVKKFEIRYFDKKITLKHNGKILVNKPSFKTQEENLYYVLGKDLKGHLFSISEKEKGISVSGFIANPSTLTYSFRKHQYLFVNGRFIKSKLIRDAIYDGFSTNLMEGRHPFFVLFIKIDPEIIDVNVHPTKIEIKFENELEIFEFVKDVIKKIFEEKEIFKPFETKSKEEDLSLSEKIPEITPQTIEKKKEEKTYYNREVQTPLEVRESAIPFEKLKKQVDLYEEEISYGPLYETLKEYRIVGQVNKTFVILETPKEMVVVDQHVAEEKFYFETFKEQLEQKQPRSQSLLKGEIIQITPQENLLYEEHKLMLERLGFQIELFGENELLVRAVPIGIKEETLSAELLKDILHEISVDKKFVQLEEEKLEKLASMSCRRSIKAGYEMTTPEIKRMIENLKRLKEPFNCPHGRPILLQYPFSDLEKKFKRIV